MDLSNEIRFKTTRSGGKGGQNVNKVETAVIAYFNVKESVHLSDQQKSDIISKLANRINSEGEIVVRAEVHRTQLSNREEALKKISTLIKKALHKKKARIATKPGKKAKEKRLESKKFSSEKKINRQKLRTRDF